MKKILIISFLVIFITDLSAQIKLDNSQSVEFYVKNVLLGNGIEVGNIKHIGKIGSLGQFDADSLIIGVKSGIILSTGNVDSVNGPNNSSGYTSWGDIPNDRKIKKELRRGDRDLNRISRRRTKDISVIEFDFIPIKNKLEFNFVFASEEYTEFVGSKFNDVFAFFLSGPGIKKKVNLAVLPDGVTPISVNTVNHKKNKKYFRRNGGLFKRLFHKIRTWYTEGFITKQKKIDKYNNHLMRQLQFDGLTTVLKVEYDVIPFQKYHIKIAIGDGSDGAYDSAVLLEAGSFVSVVDIKGVYYDTLKIIENEKLNIDSIFGIEVQTDVTSKIDSIFDKFEITDIHFDNNSSELDDTSKVKLNELAEYMNENDTLKCSLWGYTDNVGSKKHNQKLSEERALIVFEYLVSKGVERSRLSYQGYSSENPKFDNSNENGKAKNRRVEIIIE